MRHALTWVAPSPDWGRLRRPGELPGFVAPAILAFARDDFMEALHRHLDPAPRKDGRPGELPDLAEFRLQWESGALRPSGATTWPPPAGPVPKLYHPAHGRFYLVAASLVCRLPGLPDHAVDSARGEAVACVLRRVRGEQEDAWVPTGPGKGEWRPVDDSQQRPDRFAQLVAGEELRPMFPVQFRRDGKPRRLWAALIPVAGRDTYTVARPPAATAPTPLDSDVLLAEPRARVRQGLESLREAEELFAEQGSAAAANRARTRPARLQLARFFLVELAELLRTYLPAISEASEVDPRWTTAETDLFEIVRELREPLHTAWDERDRINGESIDPPDDGFDDGTLRLLLRYTRLGSPPDVPDTREREAHELDRRLLAALRAVKATPPAVDTELPRFEDLEPDEPRYVLRCVFRPHTCGPARPELVSRPTRPFVMASFFDADAPARPIRISLPIDTSVIGLRKSPRNVAFILSTTLRKQMSRLGKFKDLIDGKVGDEADIELGEICAMSIPIITICAMLVLFIFLTLLNLIFWWLPFVKLCFPIPRRSS